MAEAEDSQKEEAAAATSHALISYGPVVVTLPKIKVHTHEVDAELEAIARAHATYEPIPDRQPQDGDIVAVDITTTRDGEPFAPLTQQRALIKLGSGSMPETFEKAVEEMQVDDVRTIEYDVPVLPDDPAAPIENAHVVSEVKLYGLRREVIPSVTDAWVAATIDGAETVDDLRKIAAKNVANRKRDDRIAQMPSTLADKLSERLVGVVSDDEVEQGYQASTERLKASLDAQGVTLEQALEREGIDADEFEREMRAESRRTLAQGYALVALANHLKLEVNDEDIDQFLNASTEEEGRRLRKEYEDQGLHDRLVEGAKGMLAIRYVVHHARIMREDGSEDEAFERRLGRLYDEEVAQRGHRRRTAHGADVANAEAEAAAAEDAEAAGDEDAGTTTEA